MNILNTKLRSKLFLIFVITLTHAAGANNFDHMSIEDVLADGYQVEMEFTSEFSLPGRFRYADVTNPRHNIIGLNGKRATCRFMTTKSVNTMVWEEGKRITFLSGRLGAIGSRDFNRMSLDRPKEEWFARRYQIQSVMLANLPFKDQGAPLIYFAAVCNPDIVRFFVEPK